MLSRLLPVCLTLLALFAVACGSTSKTSTSRPSQLPLSPDNSPTQESASPAAVPSPVPTMMATYSDKQTGFSIERPRSFTVLPTISESSGRRDIRFVGEDVGDEMLIISVMPNRPNVPMNDSTQGLLLNSIVQKMEQEGATVDDSWHDDKVGGVPADWVELTLGDGTPALQYVIFAKKHTYMVLCMSAAASWQENIGFYRKCCRSLRE
jgi:hypothetical protein